MGRMEVRDIIIQKKNIKQRIESDILGLSDKPAVIARDVEEKLHLDITINVTEDDLEYDYGGFVDQHTIAYALLAMERIKQKLLSVTLNGDDPRERVDEVVE